MGRTRTNLHQFALVVDGDVQYDLSTFLASWLSYRLDANDSHVLIQLLMYVGVLVCAELVSPKVLEICVVCWNNPVVGNRTPTTSAYQSQSREVEIVISTP